MHHVLGQCPAEAHRDRAIDLPAALHRVDEPPDIRRVHAVQDADLGGDAVHGDANPVDVERNRARGKVGFAPRLEAVSFARAGGMELAERDAPLAADHFIVHETAFHQRNRHMPAGIMQYVVAQCRRRQRHRLARDDRTGARESTGVVRGQVRVGVDDVDPAGPRR